MKTAISIPEAVFHSAEQLARRLDVSRSELYSRAVSDLVAKHSDEVVKSRLNEVYGPGREDSSLDEALADVQYESLHENR